MGTRPGSRYRATALALVVLAGVGWPLQATVARPGGIAAVSQGDQCPPPGAINSDTGQPYPPTRACPNSAPQPQPETDGGRRDKDGKSAVPYLVLGGLALAAIAAAASDKPTPPPPRKPTPAELLENGPVVFAANALGTFSAYGFVQDGAPIVVDVQTDPAAATQLSVKVGDRTWSTRLEPGSEPLVIPYLGGDATEPQVALLKLTSSVRGGDGRDKPSPVQVVGLGAGQRAMGSVAINDLTFGPAVAEAGNVQALIGYRTESPFDRVATDILHYRRGSGNTVVVERVWRRAYSQLRARTYTGGPWDGRIEGSNKVSKGKHILQVTGWELNGDLAWVAAYSPSSVEVK